MCFLFTHECDRVVCLGCFDGFNFNVSCFPLMRCQRGIVSHDVVYGKARVVSTGFKTGPNKTEATGFLFAELLVDWLRYFGWNARHENMSVQSRASFIIGLEAALQIADFDEEDFLTKPRLSPFQKFTRNMSAMSHHMLGDRKTSRALLHPQTNFSWQNRTFNPTLFQAQKLVRKWAQYYNFEIIRVARLMDFLDDIVNGMTHGWSDWITDNPNKVSEFLVNVDGPPYHKHWLCVAMNRPSRQEIIDDR